MNFEQTICENLIEIDYSTFKDTYELNSARMITFTRYRTNANRFVFDLLVNENFVIYKGEKFIRMQFLKSKGKSINGHHCLSCNV